ncbi:MAG: cytochrome-c peroxidase [Bacteroidia bacterium]|nr:cytochrome-c peroxidase [Bacteroidia bacterium]
MEIPAGFPAMDIPVDNAYTEDRWMLGKKLFYDSILSVDNTISCASCHQQELAFSDGLVKSKGVESRMGLRNAPSLANIGYHPYFTREGGVPTLEMQVLVPIQEHAEMDFNIVLAADRLQKDPEYVKMSNIAYGEEPSPYMITRALANFERSLISGYSKYDEVINGNSRFSDQEEIGYNLFKSERLACTSCHSGFNFTDYSFQNNGLYDAYNDDGRYRLTGKEDDKAMFKTPSLRNVALTAPYMHDGSLGDLESVVEHYMSGGSKHQHKSEHLKGFQLSGLEKDALIAFLKTLTDFQFINNENFRNE